jgi:hypothetical protein
MVTWMGSGDHGSGDGSGWCQRERALHRDTSIDGELVKSIRFN